MRKMISLLLVAAAICACSSQSNPVLTVEGGKIQGVEVNQDVTVYRGIPYAAPPTGENRFKAPQKVVPWDGVRQMDTFSSISWQAGSAPGSFYWKEFYWEGTPEKNEDCLYLNVWAPSKTLGKKSAKLPVAMWIHGGAFMNGYGSEVSMDGTAWAERGVILVTINYRLGVLGFMSHPELTAEQGASGNYGIMDQAAALKWIHDNIAEFGGDPSNITILGQSAGAMSVKDLMFSPLSRDLIAKAIVQSGGGINFSHMSPVVGTPQSSFDEDGKKLMDNIGLTSLKAIREAPAQTIFEAANKYREVNRRQPALAPHFDKNVFPTDFDTALYDGTMAKVPVMIGYCKDDIAFLAGETVDRFCAVRDSLGYPVFEYEFMRDLPGDDSGAFHSSELWYIFGTLDNSWRPFTEADHVLSEEMVDAWTSFCKTGNPGWQAYKHDKPYKKIFDVK